VILRAPDAATANLYSCVDPVDILGFHDPGLRPEAIAALEALQTGGHASSLAVVAEDTLDDLTNPSDDLPQPRLPEHEEGISRSGRPPRATARVPSTRLIGGMSG
jgi:hypothetical protein